MENKIKLDEHTAPEGYLYRQGDRYIKTVYLAPNASIDDYELVPIEEYEKHIALENEMLS